MVLIHSFSNNLFIQFYIQSINSILLCPSPSSRRSLSLSASPSAGASPTYLPSLPDGRSRYILGAQTTAGNSPTYTPPEAGCLARASGRMIRPSGAWRRRWSYCCKRRGGLESVRRDGWIAVGVVVIAYARKLAGIRANHEHPLKMLQSIYTNEI